MASTIHRLLLLPVSAWCALVANASAADEPLTRVQIARIGKAATALVEVKAGRGQGHASAFCIHPDGWFLDERPRRPGRTLARPQPEPQDREDISSAALSALTPSWISTRRLAVHGARDLP